MSDPMKEYAEAIAKAAEQLMKVFKKQDHSGFSAYLTMELFARNFFKTQWKPAWLISAPSNIITFGGKETLEVIPLNLKAAELKIKVTIEGKK